MKETLGVLSWSCIVSSWGLDIDELYRRGERFSWSSYGFLQVVLGVDFQSEIDSRISQHLV